MMNVQELVELLGAHPFLAGFPRNHLGTLADCASHVSFVDGEAIVREDAEANRFYLLRQGRVAISTTVPGRGQVTLQTLHDGEVLGWSWLAPPHRWHFDAQSLGPTQAIVFDAPTLRTQMERDAELGYALTRRFIPVMLARMQAARRQFVDMYRQAAS